MEDGPELSYQYIMESHGQDTEASYPYKAVNEACHFNPSTVEAIIQSSSCEKKKETYQKNGNWKVPIKLGF